MVAQDDSSEHTEGEQGAGGSKSHAVMNFTILLCRSRHNSHNQTISSHFIIQTLRRMPPRLLGSSDPVVINVQEDVIG
jgi:hypothetical protein